MRASVGGAMVCICVFLTARAFCPQVCIHCLWLSLRSLMYMPIAYISSTCLFSFKSGIDQNIDVAATSVTSCYCEKHAMMMIYGYTQLIQVHQDATCMPIQVTALSHNSRNIQDGQTDLEHGLTHRRVSGQERFAQHLCVAAPGMNCSHGQLHCCTTWGFEHHFAVQCACKCQAFNLSGVLQSTFVTYKLGISAEVQWWSTAHVTYMGGSQTYKFERTPKGNTESITPAAALPDLTGEARQGCVQDHIKFSRPSESAGCAAGLLPVRSAISMLGKSPVHGLPPGCDQA